MRFGLYAIAGAAMVQDPFKGSEKPGIVHCASK
jgi:hypothetical protein